MLIGILSDIHGRIEALEMAYAEAASKCEQIVCLGDIVDGDGEADADADACMDFVRQRGIPTVRGNHDDAWLALCTVSDFGSANHKFMRGLPTWLDFEGLILVHDDPALATDTPDFLAAQGYIKSREQADRAFETAGVFVGGARIAAIGHTHVPSVYTSKGQLVELKPGVPVVLPQDASCIINPGAVGGRARSRWGNTYGTFDTERRELTIYKLNLPERNDPWEGLFQQIIN